MCSGPDNVDIEIDAVDGGEKLAVLNVDVTSKDPYVQFNCLGMLSLIRTTAAGFGFLPLRS